MFREGVFFKAILYTLLLLLPFLLYIYLFSLFFFFSLGSGSLLFWANGEGGVWGVGG